MSDPITPILAAGAKAAAAINTTENAITVVNNSRSLLNRIMPYLAPFKSSIVITGAAGVGKTVLFDHLRGEAPKIGYLPPQRSLAMENDMRPADRFRSYAYSVIPGQQNVNPRLEAQDKAFTARRKPAVVLHVVANGMIEAREENTILILKRKHPEDTPEQLLARHREGQRINELQDLDDTLVQVRRAQGKKTGSPKWFFVLINKIDLFDDAEKQGLLDYYERDEASPFVQRLNAVKNDLGAANFEWHVFPVCSLLIGFKFGDAVIKSKMDELDRDTLLLSVIHAIEDKCK